MDCEQWQKRRLHLAARTTQSQIAMTWLEDLKNSGIKQPKHTKWTFRHNKGSTMATAAKTPLLKWLAFFQTLSRLFQFTENVKCGRISLELISWGRDSSFERERKVRRHLFTFSINREIRHFHVVVVQWRQRNVQKTVLHVQSCCFANQTFFFFCRSRCRRRRRC